VRDRARPAPRADAPPQIGYTKNILSAVKANLNIDSTRIYAVGFSNGGGFVNLLACTPSTAPTFAAFATSSPALYAGTHGLNMSACDSGGHAVALIDFHGLADGQVPYAGRADRGGDTSYALPNIDAWRQQWAQRAGCSAPKATAQMAPSTVTTNYVGQNAYVRAVGSAVPPLTRVPQDVVPLELSQGDHHRIHRADDGALLAHEGRR
jgi:poly(3-hydroxybutyrate) depolymerase